MKCKQKSEFEGLLFTGDHNLLIEFLCHDKLNFEKGHTYIQTDEGEKALYSGCYIIRNAEGNVDLLTEDEFKEQFEVIENNEG